MIEKCTAKPAVEGNAGHNIRKSMKKRSEAWFPSYGLLTMKEYVQRVHLEFPCSR
jgi:hypothetical protein